MRGQPEGTTERRGGWRQRNPGACGRRQQSWRPQREKLPNGRKKGKQIVTSSTRRKPCQASKGIVIQESITDLTRSPYYQEEESEDEGHKEQMMETGNSEGNEGVYERMEVELDQKLLETMVYFKDPKLRMNCAGRVSETRKARSGRKIHYPSLRGIGAEEKFLKYIRAIGFEWLLEHAPCEVPVNPAKEFFTSFHFEYTTNLDTELIYFRVFNREMVMTLREWSLSLGLLSPEEDRMELWAMREIGQPKNTEGFDAEEAWNLIGAENADPFKTSMSTGKEIANPVLRLANVFLAHNLLGQSNTTITTIELYFLWCMLKEVKVHLGYWLAHSFHKIAHYPDKECLSKASNSQILHRNV